MKKFIYIIIGFIMGVGLTAGAAVVYNASEIKYTNEKSSATNVQEALTELTDDLMVNEADLLWTNSSITSRFDAQTISLDLSEYEYVLIDDCYTFNSCDVHNQNLIKVGTYGGVYAGYEYDSTATTWRKATVTTTGVTFTIGYHYNGNNLSDTAWAIPYHIYGVKHLTIN